MSIMESLPLAQELAHTERQTRLALIAAEVMVGTELEDFADFNDLSGNQQFAFGD